jgi:hypothetical protein
MPCLCDLCHVVALQNQIMFANLVISKYNKFRSCEDEYKPPPLSADDQPDPQDEAETLVFDPSVDINTRAIMNLNILSRYDDLVAGRETGYDLYLPDTDQVADLPSDDAAANSGDRQLVVQETDPDADLPYDDAAANGGDRQLAVPETDPYADLPSDDAAANGGDRQLVVPETDPDADLPYDDAAANGGDRQLVVPDTDPDADLPSDDAVANGEDRQLVVPETDIAALRSRLQLVSDDQLLMLSKYILSEMPSAHNDQRHVMPDPSSSGAAGRPHATAANATAANAAMRLAGKQQKQQGQQLAAPSRNKLDMGITMPDHPQPSSGAAGRPLATAANAAAMRPAGKKQKQQGQQLAAPSRIELDMIPDPPHSLQSAERRGGSAALVGRSGQRVNPGAATRHQPSRDGDEYDDIDSQIPAAAAPHTRKRSGASLDSQVVPPAKVQRVRSPPGRSQEDEDDDDYTSGSKTNGYNDNDEPAEGGRGPRRLSFSENRNDVEYAVDDDAADDDAADDDNDEEEEYAAAPPQSSSTRLNAEDYDSLDCGADNRPTSQAGTPSDDELRGLKQKYAASGEEPIFRLRSERWVGAYDEDQVLADGIPTADWQSRKLSYSMVNCARHPAVSQLGCMKWIDYRRLTGDRAKSLCNRLQDSAQDPCLGVYGVSNADNSQFYALHSIREGQPWQAARSESPDRYSKRTIAGVYVWNEQAQNYVPATVGTLAGDHNVGQGHALLFKAIKRGIPYTLGDRVTLNTERALNVAPGHLYQIMVTDKWVKVKGPSSKANNGKAAELVVEDFNFKDHGDLVVIGLVTPAYSRPENYKKHPIMAYTQILAGHLLSYFKFITGQARVMTIKNEGAVKGRGKYFTMVWSYYPPRAEAGGAGGGNRRA